MTWARVKKPEPSAEIGVQRSGTMSKIIQLIVTSGLLDEIRAAAKEHKISVAQWVRAAIHRYLIESYKLNNVSKQKPEIINLVSSRCACGALKSG
jgi:hypothetical protein